MSDVPKESWLNQMALATVIFAVCATLSTFKGGSYSTLSVISQAMASDQWAFYQAKSTKQHLHELQIQQLKLQALRIPPGDPAAESYKSEIREDERKAAKYDREKKDIQQKARDFEAQRDDARAHGKPFGIAVIFLQVAILLNSIAGLLRNKRIWWLSIPAGLSGIVCFADGFLLFFPM